MSEDPPKELGTQLIDFAQVINQNRGVIDDKKL